jgi:hypothetical protein
MIGVSSSRTNPIASAERNIKSTFAVFVVAQAVGMHVVRKVRTVKELDEHIVSHFRANDGTKNSQPFRLGLFCGKRAVCVFDEAGLRPISFEQPRLRQWLAGEYVVPAGSVVPGDVLGGDVVVPRCREARGR